MPLNRRLHFLTSWIFTWFPKNKSDKAILFKKIKHLCFISLCSWTNYNLLARLYILSRPHFLMIAILFYKIVKIQRYSLPCHCINIILTYKFISHVLATFPPRSFVKTSVKILYINVQNLPFKPCRCYVSHYQLNYLYDNLTA